MRAALLMAVLAAVLAACASTGSTRMETAEAIERILAGDHRSEAHRARDRYRHPKETLLFFGVRPEMQIVEIWPGGEGWYTEILAPLVRGQGRYYAAQYAADPSNEYASRELARFREKLASRPDLYDRVIVTTLGPAGAPIAPPGSVDMVVSFRNIHSWMSRGWAPQAFAAMYAALKPGGVLGVVEHRGRGGEQDPKARSGYVNEDYAVRLIEAAGFRLVGKSAVNDNALDTKDYEQGVWTLPPTLRLGATDRQKYLDIGESDRFTLKFEKPRH